MDHPPRFFFFIKSPLPKGLLHVQQKGCKKRPTTSWFYGKNIRFCFFSNKNGRPYFLNSSKPSPSKKDQEEPFRNIFFSPKSFSGFRNPRKVSFIPFLLLLFYPVFFIRFLCWLRRWTGCHPGHPFPWWKNFFFDVLLWSKRMASLQVTYFSRGGRRPRRRF